MVVYVNLQSYYCVEGLVKREGLYVCQVTLQRYCSSTQSRIANLFLKPGYYGLLYIDQSDMYILSGTVDIYIMDLK